MLRAGESYLSTTTSRCKFPIPCSSNCAVCSSVDTAKLGSSRTRCDNASANALDSSFDSASVMHAATNAGSQWQLRQVDRKTAADAGSLWPTQRSAENWIRRCNRGERHELCPLPSPLFLGVCGRKHERAITGHSASAA